MEKVTAHSGLCKHTRGGITGYMTKDKDSMPGHLGRAGHIGERAYSIDISVFIIWGVPASVAVFQPLFK